MSVSPLSQEVRARTMAYSFLCFQHIVPSLAVISCLSSIAGQIEHSSWKGRRIQLCAGGYKHVHQTIS